MLAETRRRRIIDDEGEAFHAQDARNVNRCDDVGDGDTILPMRLTALRAIDMLAGEGGGIPVAIDDRDLAPIAMRGDRDDAGERGPRIAAASQKLERQRAERGGVVQFLERAPTPIAPRHLTDADEEAKEEISQALFSRDEMRDIPIDFHTQFFKASAFDARKLTPGSLLLDVSTQFNPREKWAPPLLNNWFPHWVARSTSPAWLTIHL